jgi:N-methylhydantoinase A
MEQLGFEQETIQIRYLVDMRYVGQGYELTVPVDATALTADALRNAYNEWHARLYGRRMTESPVEAVTFRVTATRPTHDAPQLPIVPRLAGAAEPFAVGELFVDDTPRPLSYYRHADLPVGLALDGPVVIEQNTSTTFVPRSWRVTRDAHSTLTLERTLTLEGRD